MEPASDEASCRKSIKKRFKWIVVTIERSEIMNFSVKPPADLQAAVQDRNVPDLDWWRGAVIYQIYPRSFQDSNGDGIGDLPGITSRLAHVADLGADAVWLSPFFTSPMKDFGYDVSDYRGVDPIFGTIEDFDALV